MGKASGRRGTVDVEGVVGRRGGGGGGHPVTVLEDHLLLSDPLNSSLSYLCVVVWECYFII